jgi:hypothetical protein
MIQKLTFLFCRTVGSQDARTMAEPLRGVWLAGWLAGWPSMS